MSDDVWDDWQDSRLPKPEPSVNSTSQKPTAATSTTTVIYRERDYVEPPDPALLLNPNRIVKDPPKKILQRQTNKPDGQTHVKQTNNTTASSAAGAAAGSGSGKSLQERQDDYDRARRRILGSQGNVG